MSILREIPTVAARIRRHDVFTRHGREWTAAEEPVFMGAGGNVEVSTVGGGVVVMPRDETITVRRAVPERPCTA
ncbi:hypothetical protein AB0D97_14300 [Streptomyces roseus]|uniref:hypothetical protein n=1 Tax=Streptomyces roseus TaxID=66430 RepID=UPI0033F73F21